MFNSQNLFQVKFKSCSQSFQDPFYLTSMPISPSFSQTTYSELQFDIKDIVKNEGYWYSILCYIRPSLMSWNMSKVSLKAETVSLHREGIRTSVRFHPYTPLIRERGTQGTVDNYPHCKTHPPAFPSLAAPATDEKTGGCVWKQNIYIIQIHLNLIWPIPTNHRLFITNKGTRAWALIGEGVYCYVKSPTTTDQDGYFRLTHSSHLSLMSWSIWLWWYHE